MMKQFKLHFALVFWFTGTLLAIGQVANYNLNRCKMPVSVEQWQVVDFSLAVKQKIQKPFEVKAFAIVKESDNEQKVPLFYNGNNEWIFRYSGSTIGKKTFTVQSELKELNGKKGTIVVVANQKLNRHGGVVRDKNHPRRFFYQDGTPYCNLAFECDWLFALDYGQPTISKTEKLLDQVAKNGFNQIVMNVYAYDVDTNWVADPLLKKNPQYNYGGREDIFPFLGSNLHPDHSALNVAFFKHLDKVILSMHNREIVSHLMIYVWNKLVNWPEPGSAADDMYYQYVVKRYQAFPNIIWDVSKEATSKIAQSKFKNIGEHIRKRVIDTRATDAYHRLVSVHDYGFCKKNKDIVDFISIQNWKLSIYDQMLEAYKEFPEMPVYNIEHGGYEKAPYNVFPGGYDNAEVCLRRNYLCLFAGTHTTYYWQGTAWTAIIHNPFEQPEGMIKPHFEYFKYMRGFIDMVNIGNFEPVTTYNTRSYNLTDYKNGMVLQYMPKEVYNDDVRDQLDKEFDYSNATYQWFNTITGEYSKAAKVEFKDYYTIWDWRPWRNEADAILIIKNLKNKNSK